MIGDMARGVRGHVPDVGDMRAQPHLIAARHQPVGGRDTLALGFGGDDLAAGLCLYVALAAGFLGVPVVVAYVGDLPLPRVRLRQHRIVYRAVVPHTLSAFVSVAL